MTRSAENATLIVTPVTEQTLLNAIAKARTEATETRSAAELNLTTRS